MEEIKYTVEIKKKYKVFNYIFSALCFAFAAWIAILSISSSETFRDYIVNIAVLIFFFTVSLICLYQNCKCVKVYKGKVIYKTLFRQIEYKPSEICTTKTKIETIESVSCEDGILPGCGSYDEKTVFYDEFGKKLFSFGLAYNNVKRFEEYIVKNRKSYLGN